jgi:hypothetical protein
MNLITKTTAMEKLYLQALFMTSVSVNWWQGP